MGGDSVLIVRISHTNKIIPGGVKDAVHQRAGFDELPGAGNMGYLFLRKDIVFVNYIGIHRSEIIYVGNYCTEIIGDINRPVFNEDMY